MAHVQEAGDPIDVAKRHLVEAVFATGEGEDHRVLRGLFRKLRVVVSSGFGAVAPSDEKKVADVPVFYGVDDLGSHAQHGVVTKAHQDFVVVSVLIETRGLEGGVDDWGEVPIGDVGDIRPGH